MRFKNLNTASAPRGVIGALWDCEEMNPREKNQSRGVKEGRESPTVANRRGRDGPTHPFD